MSKEKNDFGTLLQLTDENGEPLYCEKENFDSPLLSHTKSPAHLCGLGST